ncbi:hypothetical protein ZWY2020_057343 [Hordeum vulgare]|nr:hypothetical protein ZWY2020_057343 [Hordeum vulgare]
MIIQLEGGTIGAHYCILGARAPGFLKRHRQRRAATGRCRSPWMAETCRTAVRAPIQPPTRRVCPSGGLDGAGHKAMIRHLLIAAERYGMGRLRAICERVLCKSLDIETVAATLAMADRHGFKKLSEA